MMCAEMRAVHPAQLGGGGRWAGNKVGPFELKTRRPRLSSIAERAHPGHGCCFNASLLPLVIKANNFLLREREGQLDREDWVRWATVTAREMAAAEAA